MNKIFEIITAKFQHPLSLLFFLLGSILVLLGLVTYLNWSTLKVVPDDSYQGLALILGVICLLIAIAFYRSHPVPNKVPEAKMALPSELMLSFPERERTLSHTQREVLEYLEKELSRVTEVEKLVYFEKVQDEFKMSPSELFYRLEQLRLLKFIETKKVSNPLDARLTQAYNLSPEYEKVCNCMPHRQKTST